MKKKISTVQDFIPIKNLMHGIIETKDGRFLKIFHRNILCSRNEVISLSFRLKYYF